MAKGKYEDWLTGDGLTLLEGWARDGLTDEQIASNCGISPSTLYRWKDDHQEIREALLNKALGGDTTAQIFWLKNRRPDKWRDKPSGDKSADEHIGVIEIGAVKEDNT